MPVLANHFCTSNPRPCIRRRRKGRDARRRLVVLAIQFALNLLHPLTPPGLTFQLEQFLAQFLALFHSLLTRAKAGFLRSCGSERGLAFGRARQRRLAFAQGRRRAFTVDEKMDLLG